MKNCIFICVFTSRGYLEMLYMLLDSLYTFGKPDNSIDILIYTTTNYMQEIKSSSFFTEKIKFEINDDYYSIDFACKARLDLFELKSVFNYNKILYLDTDILIKKPISNIFNLIEKEVLYVLEEGVIYHDSDSWGKTLFGNEIGNYEDKSAFTSGILLFANCEKVKDLFVRIKEDIKLRPHEFGCYDQPYFVYNAFKYNMFDNKKLKSVVANHDYDAFNNIIIDHFPGCAGNPVDKLKIMTGFLEYLKRVLI